MFRAGMCVVTGAFVAVAAWAAAVHFTPADAAAPPAESKPVADAKEAKPVDLTALRDAVDTAARKGENVDEIRTALDAFEKTKPRPAAGRVPAELQALRDAVDTAARKGENVEAITKELVAVETAVAGKSLAKPRPQPQPEPQPPGRPGFPMFPNPGFPAPPAFPNFPAPAFPNPGLGGGAIDVETFNKAMELRRKAVELMLKNPRDPEVMKEARKLQAEAMELLLKAAGGLGGGAGGLGGLGAMPAFPGLPGFPDLDRVPDRARLGIRMDRVPALAAEQLGLEPNTGIAVAMVMPGSAAEKAGLKVHDIILEFAGKAVSDNTEDFTRRVGEVKAGEKVDLVVLRKGKKVEVKGVELPAKPIRAQPQPFPALDAAIPAGLLPDPAAIPNLNVPAQPVPGPAPQPDPAALPKPLPLPATPVFPLPAAPGIPVPGTPPLPGANPAPVLDPAALPKPLTPGRAALPLPPALPVVPNPVPLLP